MLGTESLKRRQDEAMPKGKDAPENIKARRESRGLDAEDKCENKRKTTEDSWFVSDELSDGLVLFSSDEGRKIFFESASSGYLNSYFELAQNFLTSFEPRFSCSLATLTMCLNTFREDPHRIWKDVYRWYAQTMLEHCVPYRVIEGNGVVFQQFACMAEANNLKVALVRNLKPTATIDEFREVCKRTTSGSCDEILVVCYHRKGLDQKGTGHYSSIGGYHPEKDLVLVFDISRYKYPLHWVPVKRLWNAMTMFDSVTGNPRGYFVLTKRTHLDKSSLLLFKTINPEDSPSFHRGWLKFFETALLPWHNWMKSSDVQTVDSLAMLGFVVRTLFRFMTSSRCSGIDHLAGIHMRLEFKDAGSSLNKRCLVCEVREAIESNVLWKFVADEIAKGDKQNGELKGDEKTQEQSPCQCWSMLIDEVAQYQHAYSSKMCCDLKIQPSVCHLRQFNLAHYITMIVLSWPYDINEMNGQRNNTRVSTAMNDIVSAESSRMSKLLKEEVANCRRRFQKTQFALQ